MSGLNCCVQLRNMLWDENILYCFLLKSYHMKILGIHVKKQIAYAYKLIFLLILITYFNKISQVATLT
jgi:hypothetical protein